MDVNLLANNLKAFKAFKCTNEQLWIQGKILEIICLSGSQDCGHGPSLLSRDISPYLGSYTTII